MVPDYKPTVPEWFHQQFELEMFLAEQRARVEAEERKAARRRGLYFAGTAVCWLIVSFVLMISTHLRYPVPGRSSQPVRELAAETPAPLNIVYVQPQWSIATLLPESDAMKQLLDQLGAIEVQGSVSTYEGDSFRGPLWVRTIKHGKTVYLEDAQFYEIDGPFRLRIPPDSTVYIYAQAPGLDWNSSWGVPVRTPACSQPGRCAVRLEDLLTASTGK